MTSVSELMMPTPTMKITICVVLVSLSTFASTNKLAGNLVEPGRYCDPVLYDQLIRPSSEALRKLYREVETEKQISAAVQFGIAARNMQRSLHALIEGTIPEHEENKVAYKQNQGNHILASKACLGLVASFLTCDAERHACVCKNEFPFNFTLENGECHGLPGSICAVDKSFLLPCTGDTICEKEGIKAMRFCGGVPAYKKEQESLQEPAAYKKEQESFQEPAILEVKVQEPKSYLSPPDVKNTNQEEPVAEAVATNNDQGHDRGSASNDSLSNLTAKLEELSQNLNSNSEKLKTSLQKIEQLEEMVENITKRFESEKLSYDLHRHRIILLGVPEIKNEDERSLRTQVESLVSDEDLNVQGVMCGRIQRIGIAKPDGKPRAVKINFCFQ